MFREICWNNSTETVEHMFAVTPSMMTSSYLGQAENLGALHSRLTLYEYNRHTNREQCRIWTQLKSHSFVPLAELFVVGQ